MDKRLDVSGFSSRFSVRVLDERDADEIFRLCRGNTQFYQFCGAKAEKEQVLRDLRITPPGVDASFKYYLGFYEGQELIAVMDLIDGYPEPGIGYIGFFMLERARQGKELGSSIIREVEAYWKRLGNTALRLGIDKENPQSTHFWKKNGFSVIREVEREGWTVLVAEKKL